MSNFRLLRPSTLYPIFLQRLFSNLFSSKSPSIFTRNETLSEHKRLLRVFGTIRLTGDLQKTSENFEKKFSIFFYFLKSFRVRDMVFLLFPVGEKWLLSLMRIPP